MLKLLYKPNEVNHVYLIVTSSEKGVKSFPLLAKPASREGNSLKAFGNAIIQLS